MGVAGLAPGISAMPYFSAVANSRTRVRSFETRHWFYLIHAVQ
jgi:hypothetical protein